jgi:ubiquinol-cytochrome c reductase cytochrome b subunit
VTGPFLDWLDHRTGYRKLLDVLLLEDIPGGARWRYVWGSALVFVFSLQLVTGILLMTAYSPSDTSAWASVHFIQYRMDFGWLIRGLHHFGSQTMMVLIALHMLQVVIAGAHLPPREVNWWLGLALLSVTFGLSLTGYLLPWDQKGYWATRVATNIASNTPLIGDFLRRVLVGGDDYGNHTLTRFYALHVAVLPLSLIALLVAHLAVFRRHGVTAPRGAEGGEYFWPGQAFKDLIVCLGVFGVMLGLVIYGHGNPVDVPEDQRPANLYQEIAHAGQKGWGANLDAPADRDTQGYPARPEWYFLFLFQLLKYFEGEHVLIGTFVIPNAAMVLLFLLPLLGYGGMRKFGHFFGILVMFALVGAAGLLTLLALAQDSPEPILFGLVGNKKDGTEASEKRIHEAKAFQDKVEKAQVLAKRAADLAMAGVPEEGGRWLLRNDPLTAGHELFKTRCAGCHSLTARPGDPFEGFPHEPARHASDLGAFGTRAWVRGLLDNPSDPRYFGNMPQLTGMKGWKAKLLKKRAKMGPDEIARQEAEFDTIAAWLADQANLELTKQAGPLFEDHCGSCHTVAKVAAGETAPDLTGWGSADWIRGMVMDPAHPSRYGMVYKDRDPKELVGLMPAFRNFLEGPGSELARREFFETHPGFPENLVSPLTDVERELVIRFVARDFRVVFGGRTIAAAPN